MNVADLAVAAHVDGVFAEQREAVLFEARSGCDKFIGVGSCEPFDGPPKGEVDRFRTGLVKLTLRGEAGHGGARAGAVGESRCPLGCRIGRRGVGRVAKLFCGEDAGGGKLVWICFWCLQRVADGKEPVERQPGVAGGSGRGSAGTEFQKVEVVVVDQKHDGHRDDGGF